MTSAKSSPPNKPTEIQEEIEDLCEWLQDEDNIIGCTILFQKKYGEASAQFKLLRSDFCLIVATNKRRLLHEHGVRTLCLDRIPWNRSDDLSITALFVVDTCGFEHTVAFMLSDRSDAYIYEVFFTKLRKYLEEAQPEVVLTPVSQSVFSAFRNATKNEAAKGAFSPWQVDESWRGQLRLIKKAEKRKEVYKALRGLQLESDAAEFDEAYARLLDELKSDPVSWDIFHPVRLETKARACSFVVEIVEGCKTITVAPFNYFNNEATSLCFCFRFDSMKTYCLSYTLQLFQ